MKLPGELVRVVGNERQRPSNHVCVDERVIRQAEEALRAAKTVANHTEAAQRLRIERKEGISIAGVQAGGSGTESSVSEDDVAPAG